MDRRVAELNAVLLGQPLLDVLVAAKALRLGETVFQSFHYARRNRLLTGLWSRIFDLLDLLDPSFFVELKPIGNRMANRMAMDIQLASGSASAFGLSSLQQKEHLEAALDLSVFLLTNEAFELPDGFGNLRKVVHDREAFLGPDDSGPVIAQNV
jgi:hypothetical protein